MAAGVLLEKERRQWLLEQCVPNTAGIFVFNVARADLPLMGGTLVPSPTPCDHPDHDRRERLRAPDRPPRRLPPRACL